MPINNLSLFITEAKDAWCLKEWLSHPHSLTDKLQTIKGSTELEVLSQSWVKTSWWDVSLLHINDPFVFQREILMKSEGKVYWYARTIIPQQCYQLNSTFFNRLETESVRNLIFNDSRVQRLNKIDYPVDSQCIEFHWVKRYLPEVKEPLWLRLAEYSFEGLASFYLVEVLLPELGELNY